MGCDIYLYFERKNPEGKWEQIMIPEKLVPEDRNYELFAFLADVRNSSGITAQFADRGIPADSTCPINPQDCMWFGDSRFTYAYLDEILKAPWKKVKLDRCYFYVFCYYVLPRLFHFGGYLDAEEERNIRVIMGFDS